MPFMEALTRDGVLGLSCRGGGGLLLVLLDGGAGLTMLDGFVGGLRFLPMIVLFLEPVPF